MGNQMRTQRSRIPFGFSFFLSASVICATLTGCAGIDASLTDRVSNLNASLDQSTNDGILLNIVRASRYEPLTFVAVSKVNSTQSVTLTNGLPTLFFGPGLTTAQHQFIFGSNSINNVASGNFDLGPLATKEFAAGVSTDISLVELSTLIKEGIPRDLLFNLLVESITLEKKIDAAGGKSSKWEPVYLRNEPGHEQYLGFRATALILTALGYSVETRMDVNPVWDATDKNTAKYKPKGRLCFDPTLADSGTIQYLSESRKKGPYFKSMDQRFMCGDWSRKRPTRLENEPDTIVEIWAPGYTTTARNIVFRFRSIYGVFGFLGRQVKNGELEGLRTADDKDVRINGVKLYKALAADRWDIVKDIFRNRIEPQLLRISERDGASCFAAARVGGKRYCVPQDAQSATTRRVFSVLAQLLALKTTAADLPVTPTVRVTP
jgi:hypothetical protein